MLVFSNLWVGGAAALLAATASLALGTGPNPAALGLAFGGTLAVYGADRLRDVEADRATTPARSAFVERHRRHLTALALAGLLVAIGCAAALGREVVVLAGAVAMLAAAHPLLKRIPFTKALYLTAAWLGVVVGVPALAATAESWRGVAIVLGGALAANAIASSLRDGEGGAARVGPRVALGVAAALAACSLVVALAGPATLRPLAAVPAATLAAVAAFRPGERYGLVVIDGALGAGAFLALLLQTSD